MVASAVADVRPSLLVVDDDSRVRTVVGWQFEAEGYDVVEAADGNAAWQAHPRAPSRPHRARPLAAGDVRARPAPPAPDRRRPDAGRRPVRAQR